MALTGIEAFDEFGDSGRLISRRLEIGKEVKRERHGRREERKKRKKAYHVERDRLRKTREES